MKIETFTAIPLATNGYVISVSHSKEAAIIDPGLETEEKISRYLQAHQLKPTKILLTHSHWDHIGNVAALKRKYGIDVYIHPDDAENLRHPGSDGLPAWIPIEGVEPDHYLAESDKIALGNAEFEILCTPGHSPGGVCFYESSQKILFSGDTLFKGTIGNLSFPTGDPEKMMKSLEKLAALPPDTAVYPGHGEPTRIGSEAWLSRARKVFFNEM